MSTPIRKSMISTFDDIYFAKIIQLIMDNNKNCSETVESINKKRLILVNSVL